MNSATAPVYGLILAGGSSSRMHRDKAALAYLGKTQLDRAFELAGRHVARVFVSVRSSQTAEPTRARRPLIIDSVDGEGPIAGIRSALVAFPDAAWLVLACDLPFLSDAVLEQLLAERDPSLLATAYRSVHDGLPEPLCAVWEPAAAAALSDYQGSGGRCPRKFMMRHSVRLLEARDRHALDNINTPEEYAQAMGALDIHASVRGGPDTHAHTNTHTHAGANPHAGAHAGPDAKDHTGTGSDPCTHAGNRTPPRARTGSHTHIQSRPIRLTIQYFALMREQAGRSEETLETFAATPADLYSELNARHGFTLSREQLKVAINTEFSDWSSELASGDAVVFIPPVAGG